MIYDAVFKVETCPTNPRGLSDERCLAHCRAHRPATCPSAMCHIYLPANLPYKPTVLLRVKTHLASTTHAASCTAALTALVAALL